MIREAWTIRRSGRALIAIVVSVEPSLLDALPHETERDGTRWIVVGQRK